MTAPLRGLPLAALFIGVLSAPVEGRPGAQPSHQAEAPETQPVELSTDHLRVKYVRTLDASPGEQVSLAVEIAPRTRMHVYAPGAGDYQVITVVLDESPLFRARPLTYPPSEIYFFEPLKERVPVYQNAFKLIQDIDLAAGADAGAALAPGKTVSVTGTLEYQACDDRICFKPVSLPLTWTITLRSATRGAAVAPGGPQ
jgi:hypothetical protein